jgi:hypothetical protein
MLNGAGQLDTVSGTGLNPERQDLEAAYWQSYCGLTHAQPSD